ncbi:hypothetical protein, partial [Pseudomonas sp. CM27]|uniref:hypothetical protein n=1 Tax=Pseudomonas sp. CM27 TaxID=2738452 RepID=UPI001556598E|nr:hypothetical protein [Pseudomonas sp. CM27]
HQVQWLLGVSSLLFSGGGVGVAVAQAHLPISHHLARNLGLETFNDHPFATALVENSLPLGGTESSCSATISCLLRNTAVLCQMPHVLRQPSAIAEVNQ